MSLSAFRPLVLLALTALVAPAQDAKTEVDDLAKAVRTKFCFEETDNFIWALEMGAGPAKKVIRAGEKAMEIWFDISGHDSFRRVFGDRKCLVGVTKNRRNYQRLVAWYEKTHPVGWSGFKEVATAGEFFLMPYPRVMIMHHMKPRPIEEVPGVIAHEVGRMLMMRHEFHRNFVPPWLEEGFGLWLESRATGRNVCFTFGEAYGGGGANKDKLTGITLPKWKTIVRRMAGRNRDAPMKAILPRRLSELGGEQAGKAWSVIDFLIAKDKRGFPKFVKEMKSHWPKSQKPEYEEAKGEAQKKALMSVYEMSLQDLDNQWRAYVKKGFKL